MWSDIPLDDRRSQRFLHPADSSYHPHLVPHSQATTMMTTTTRRYAVSAMNPSLLELLHFRGTGWSVHLFHFLRLRSRRTMGRVRSCRKKRRCIPSPCSYPIPVHALVLARVSLLPSFRSGTSTIDILSSRRSTSGRQTVSSPERGNSTKREWCTYSNGQRLRGTAHESPRCTRGRHHASARDASGRCSYHLVAEPYHSPGHHPSTLFRHPSRRSNNTLDSSFARSRSLLSSCHYLSLAFSFSPSLFIPLTRAFLPSLPTRRRSTFLVSVFFLFPTTWPRIPDVYPRARNGSSCACTTISRYRRHRGRKRWIFCRYHSRWFLSCRLLFSCSRWILVIIFSRAFRRNAVTLATDVTRLLRVANWTKMFPH